MRTLNETDAEAREYADNEISRWNGEIPPGQMRVGPPCITTGEHDWWHLAAAKKGIRQLPDGSSENQFIDMVEHNECTWCGKWEDPEAFERQRRTEAMR